MKKHQAFFTFCICILSFPSICNALVLSLRRIHNRFGALKARSSSGGDNGNDTKVLPSSLLILGLGRVGQQVAKQVSPHFDVIYGTKRSIIAIENDGATDTSIEDCINVQQILFDGSAIERALSSSSCRHVLVTMPPFLKEVAIPEQRPNGKNKKAGDSYDDNTKPSEQSVTIPYDKILQRYIMSTTKSPAWIGVISTTGVYGDHNGQWVDELSECLCSEDSNAADYLRWEQLWQNFGREHSSRVAIFRCAGIYGSTRSSLHTLYKGGAMSPKNQVSAPSSSSPSLSITNRIHEDDLTASVVASMLINMADAHECTTNNVEIYSLSDNLPESRQVVFDYAKQLFASRNITIPAQSTTPPQKANKRSVRRRQEVKRVCNQKMRSQFLSELKFPTYKEGLAHILDQPSTPWSDQGLF